MLSLRYFEPAPGSRAYLSCLYVLETPVAMTDMLRAEVPNLRIFLEGGATVHVGGEARTFRAPIMILCGPTMQAGHTEIWPGTRLVGASILPQGWQACFGLAADDMADRFEDCEGLAPRLLSDTVAAMREAPDPIIAMAYLERCLMTLGARRPLRDEAFIAATAQWLADGDLGRVDNLVNLTDLSRRQVERLSLKHFGATPKGLQRKFRTLHACNEMAWKGLSDWRDVAGESYYDQSHFIRDFKTFIGTTPGQFTDEYRDFMKAALMLRRTVQHVHPLSLVA